MRNIVLISLCLVLILMSQATRKTAKQYRCDSLYSLQKTKRNVILFRMAESCDFDCKQELEDMEATLTSFDYQVYLAEGCN